MTVILRKWNGPANSVTLNGPELITLNDNQWDQLCGYDEIIFNRTTPEQKLRIVKEFQKREHTVGMIGDGVKDVPFLKTANLASEPSLKLSTTAVFDNLKKTIIYPLPAGTFSKFWPIFTSVIFGLPQILSSFLMIIICCLMDYAPITVLAYEKPEAGALLRRL
ncbi:hypothetical protein EG329_006977 [Mollisiaceae sp. DMI_Dod_QoI]|nr:hypothetical protein EG329_006977 [Helotiales sp. DMI_Dod_QoI]